MEDTNTYAFKNKTIGRKNCIVFDYDCTLTSTHFYHFINSPSEFKKLWGNDIQNCDELINRYSQNVLSMPNNIAIDTFFGGIERFTELENMLIRLNDNYDVFISSRGFCENIIPFLKKLNLHRLFVEVNANEYTVFYQDKIYCAMGNQGKVSYIMNLWNTYDNIIYVDDNDGEYIAIKELPKYKNNPNKLKYLGESELGLEKDKKGLTIEMIYKLLKISNLRLNETYIDETTFDDLSQYRDIRRSSNDLIRSDNWPLNLSLSRSTDLYKQRPLMRSNNSPLNLSLSTSNNQLDDLSRNDSRPLMRSNNSPLNLSLSTSNNQFDDLSRSGFWPPIRSNNSQSIDIDTDDLKHAQEIRIPTNLPINENTYKNNKQNELSGGNTKSTYYNKYIKYK